MFAFQVRYDVVDRDNDDGYDDDNYGDNDDDYDGYDDDHNDDDDDDDDDGYDDDHNGDNDYDVKDYYCNLCYTTLYISGFKALCSSREISSIYNCCRFT